MGFLIRVLMMLGMLICLSSVVIAKEGTSVFYYRPYVPSACYRYENKGSMIAGANFELYDGGKICGRKYKVRCLGGTNETPNPCKEGEIIVRMVDLCDGCGDDEINLSRDAFSRIAKEVAGRVRVNYTEV